MARRFGAALLLFLVGCGGSSSETPFPLEPDRATLRGDGGPPPGARYVALPAGESPSEGESEASEPLPEMESEPGSAPSTWGEKPPRSERAR